MLAAGLAGLSSGDEDDGMIPVGKIGDKAFRGAMAAAGGAWTENGARLRPIAKTERFFRKPSRPRGWSMSRELNFLHCQSWGRICRCAFQDAPRRYRRRHLEARHSF